VEIYRRALRIGFAPAISQVLGISDDTLSSEWKQRVEQTYAPLMTDRGNVADVGHLLLSPETGAGHQNLSPILSPDGRYIAFMSEKDLFSVDLYLADAHAVK
jgi:Tol biopolymer transport system component